MGKARGKLSGAALAEFNAKHPHGAGGKFVKKGGAAAALKASSPSNADRINQLTKQINDLDGAIDRGRGLSSIADSLREKRDRLKAERTALGAEVMGKTGTVKAKKAREALKAADGGSGRISAADLPAALAEIDALVANPKTEADRDRVKNLLSRMTLPQIKQVADKHHNGLLIGGNKDEKVRRLTDSIVGTKLDSAAIARGVHGRDSELAAPAPAKKSARAALGGKVSRPKA